MTNTVAIIQARMASTRLPNKVLMDIVGKPMLWHVIERIKRCKNVDSVIVATTQNEEDRKIIEIAKECSVDTFAGSEQDVLNRYYHAAKTFKVDTIVRITADCPVIDPEIVDDVIERYDKGNYDGCSLAGAFPDGLDVTVFSFDALEKTWKYAKLPSEREHVDTYMWKHPDKFNLCKYEKFTDCEFYRWTVDEERDLKFIREVYVRLYNTNKMFLTNDILELLKREPALLEINEDIIRNEGYLKSLKKDEGTKAL